ncbi:MAG: hypothetical protein ACYC7H_01530 [Chloroflexota bacterium]
MVGELSAGPSPAITGGTVLIEAPPAAPETAPEAEIETHEVVGLALANSVAGNGIGPRLAFRPALLPRVDGDKATGLMASALSTTATVSRVPRKRQPWREVSN